MVDHCLLILQSATKELETLSLKSTVALILGHLSNENVEWGTACIFCLENQRLFQLSPEFLRPI